MRRLWWLMTVALLAAGSVSVNAVALPGRVLACSCAGPPPALAEVAAQDDVSVVIATPGQPLEQVTPVTVEAWFHGANPADAVWLSGGTGMVTSCDIFLTTGAKYLLVLYNDPATGVYSTNMCAPSGQVGTPEGDQLVAEAQAVFGTAQPPPSPSPEPAGAAEPSPWLGSGLVWVLGGVAAALALFGLVLVVGLRRQAR